MTPLRQRIAELTERGLDDECWRWLGAHHAGYPVISADGQQLLVRRLVWSEAHAGQILQPRRMIISLCNNRWCISPQHLALNPTRARGEVAA